MPKIFIPLILLVMPLTLFSQRDGFLKYGVGFSFDKVEHYSNDPTARNAQSKQVISEFLYDQYLNKYFSVEIGVRDKYLETRIDFYDTDTTSLRLAGNLVVLPLHIKARFLFLDKFIFSPGIGASLLISHTFNGIDYRVTKPYQEVTLVKQFPKNYFTFDINAGLHYLMSPSWKASVDIAYNFHSKTIAEAGMQNNLRATTSTIRAKGTFSYFTVGIAYRLSNIWIKDR